MPPLSPTIWRTCRVLNGRIRLQLLRMVITHPGFNVSELAHAVGVGVSDASQELRRIQSRGLIRRTCRGPAVVYMPVSDPLVPSAAPLLLALESAWATAAAPNDAIESIAKGLAHERRVALVRALASHPRAPAELMGEFHTGSKNLTRHLSILRQTGWVVWERRAYHLLPATHPVHVALLKLL